ncbi:haloacid dehalogenase-like hydrolase [Fulvimarina sp. 2208YS6-2-32]|uniref:Haloacid dehalogenase-like hydrolase n=1 Tax=Fulvimarina uroteuthidis TaxID=3098149 RepID=A0ABU5I6F8_9HYPH|nr:haloacid dehalogenase-like hydrolase [Fulvimarina sp. 2208YS6-2-32]MDY8110394.1 haloacid dehalogenase-like hydrolase [Fulvimarina sp. 2208YS6-2-32]
MQITRPLHDRIALAFDFDKTLAESSLDVIVAAMGLDVDEWHRRYREPLDSNTWDSINARAYALIEAGRDNGRPLTRDTLRDAGRTIRLYDEVTLMPDRIRAAAREIAPGVEVDFTVISSGYVDLIEHTAIKDCFDRIWGSSLHFDDRGEAVFIKRGLTHPEKARYMQALSKGLSIKGSNAPESTTKAVADEDLAVPPNQMIFVGDGASDLQAFQYVETNSGFAIAVRQNGGFAGAKTMHADQRPSNLAPPSYAQGGEMLKSLIHAVQSIASRIALTRLGEKDA